MRQLLTAAVTVLTLVPAAWASDDKDDKQNKDTQTICGIVAGVTVAGETALDTRTNTAVTVEGAYLTIVGLPKDEKGEAFNRRDNNTGEAANRRDSNVNEAANRDNNSENKSGEKMRHNIYMVWMMPSTKVWEKKSESGKESAPMDVTLDKLEIGDRVEIQFNRGEESSSTRNSPNVEQMRRKHGRHRTYVGFAKAITIMPAKERDTNTDRDAKESTVKDGSPVK